MMEYGRVTVDRSVVSINGERALYGSRAARGRLQQAPSGQLHVARTDIDMDHRLAVSIIREEVGARRDRRHLSLLARHTGKEDGEVKRGDEYLVEVCKPVI